MKKVAIKKGAARRMEPALTGIGLGAWLIGIFAASLAVGMEELLAGRRSWWDLSWVPACFLSIAIFGGLGALAGVMLLAAFLSPMERRGISSDGIHGVALVVGAILGMANGPLSVLLWINHLPGGTLDLLLPGAVGGASAAEWIARGVLRRRNDS